MKYITYINKHGAEDIRIFSTMEEHKNVALEMEDANKVSEDDEIVFLGAGFIDFTVPECHGFSDSMKLDNRGEKDTKILNINMKISRKR